MILVAQLYYCTPHSSEKGVAGSFGDQADIVVLM